MPPLSPLSTNATIPEYFKTLAELDDYFDSPGHTRPNAPPGLKAKTVREGPQLLVCHDYKGGYNDSPTSMGYTFNFWPHIDLFIYFSHYRVAPPPSSWIQAAHREGVPILGTLIFEWDESKPDLHKFLYPQNGDLAHYARLLARLADERGFDGWLLNVEVNIEGGTKDAVRLKDWIVLLKQEMKNERQVIWYDSVTDSGALRWQDRLCAANEAFFAAAGKLFTNYTWAPHYPQLSVQYLRDMRTHHHVASSSLSGPASPPLAPTDIFVGIDVWGRGTHGGGGFGAHKALEHIVPSGSSAALFAPAWTYESREAEWTNWEAWWQEECRFWVGARSHAAAQGQRAEDDSPEPIMPGFYPAGCHHPRFRPIAHFFLARPLAAVLLPWATTFGPGVGRRWFVRGRELEDHAGEWTDMRAQSYIPVTAEGAQLCFDDAWVGGTSLRISATGAVDGSPNASRWIALRVLGEISQGAELRLDVVWKSGRPGEDVRVLPGLASEDHGETTQQSLENGWYHSSCNVALSASSVELGVTIQGASGPDGEVLLGAFGARLGGQQWADGEWADVFPA